MNIILTKGFDLENQITKIKIKIQIIIKSKCI